MRGYVANTDYDWFSFLSAHTPLDEVNFWQPSGGKKTFRVLGPGEPFFFRLKAPHNKIAGFGWFARHERLVRSSLAWDAFGIANGAETLEAVRRRIKKYAEKRPIQLGTDYPVGCLMISQPVFFPESKWIDQPRDWAPNIVTGKGYDTGVGEGRRVFEECLAQLPAPEQPVAEALMSGDGSLSRYGQALLVQPRLGQGTFRIGLNSAYDGACAVTNEHSWPVLEAAHIRPYSAGGEHRLCNGLLLRADIHKLFDKGYVTITPDYLFKVSGRLEEEWNNGRAYYKRQGAPIRVPEQREDQPSKTMLEWHNQEVFLG